MYSTSRKFVLSAILTVFGVTQTGFAVDRDELATKYPSIEEGSQKPENKKILCPFHRLLERAGLYNGNSSAWNSALLVNVLKITRATHEFGCDIGLCSSIATATSAGQIAEGASTFGKVNLEALHRVLGVSHECGLTFAKGTSVVSDEVRNNTLAALFQRADSMGRLSLEDLKAVKQSICEAQGVKNTFIGAGEVGLIYTFLGGSDRGFVDYADVERFFHAELPKTIGKPTLPAGF